MWTTVRRRAMATLLGIAVAVLGLALAPQRACACSTRLPMLKALPRTLALLAEQQEFFLADSGRLASRETLEAWGWHTRGSGVEFKEFATTDSTLRAVVWMPDIATDVSCTLTMRADGSPPVQDCLKFPDKGKEERRAALIYAGMLLLGVVTRVAVAGRSMPPIRLASAIPVVGLLVVTPVWLNAANPSWCDELTGVSYLWVVFAGVYVLRNLLFGSYEPPQPPSAPRGPRGPRTPQPPRPPVPSASP